MKLKKILGITGVAIASVALLAAQNCLMHIVHTL